MSNKKIDPLHDDMETQQKKVADSQASRELLLPFHILDVLKDKINDMSADIIDMTVRKATKAEIQQYLSIEIDNVLNGIMRCTRFVTDERADKNINLYIGTHWVSISNQMMLDFVKDCCEKAGLGEKDRCNPKYIFSIIDRILLKNSRAERPVVPHDQVWINLQNGTLEMHPDGTTIFREHRPEDFFTYVLPYAYDPKAECPEFMAYLDHVQPDKNVQQLIAQYAGYCFTNNIKAEKMLILYGRGSNGKSVLLDTLRAMYGKNNVSEVPLSDLTTDEGKRTLIENKLVNISSENSKQLDPSNFKILVSGEPVLIKKLYLDPYSTTKYGKLIASYNTLPNPEQTQGFQRRIILVPFNVTISDEEANLDLAKELCQELPGILNWAIQGLKEFTQSRRFAVPEKCKKALNKYMKDADSVKLFIEECCEMNYHLLTHGQDIYKAYSEYCRNDNLRPLGKQKFYNRLPELGATPEDKKGAKYFNIKLR